jgi:hypothetical protein
MKQEESHAGVALSFLMYDGKYEGIAEGAGACQEKYEYGFSWLYP